MDGAEHALGDRAELERLRRAVYAPEGDSQAADRYHALRRRLDAERPADDPSDEPAPVREGSEPAAPERSTPDVPSSPHRSAAPVLAGAAVVGALLVGALLAPVLGGRPAPVTSPSPSPSPVAATAPFISGASGTGSALDVFGETQRDADRPAIPLNAHLLPTSFRRLRSVPSRAVSIYAAQDSDGDICLVAMSFDRRLAVSCTSIAQFRARPIRLAFSAVHYRSETATSGVAVELVATWGFLGRFDLTERPVAGE